MQGQRVISSLFPRGLGEPKDRVDGLFAQPFRERFRARLPDEQVGVMAHRHGADLHEQPIFFQHVPCFFSGPLARLVAVEQEHRFFRVPGDKPGLRVADGRSATGRYVPVPAFPNAERIETALHEEDGLAVGAAVR